MSDRIHDTEPAGDALIVRVEGTLWKPGKEWELALAHLRDRFARVLAEPLELTTVSSDADGVAATCRALATWADGRVDWQRELARFFDEHLSMHLRPDPSLSRDVRTLGRDHTLVAVSALPPAAAAALLRHAGVNRAFSQVLGDCFNDTAAVAAARAAGAGTAEAVVTDPAGLTARRSAVGS